MNEVSTAWAIVLEIGFIGWVASTIAFIFKAFDKEDNFIPKQALKWGIIIVIFYALWITGMMKA